MLDVGQWIVIIAFVLGFMAVLVIGVWYAFNWTMQTAIGISVLELCSRVGLAGEIVLILASLILIGIVVSIFNPCMDMC